MFETDSTDNVPEVILAPVKIRNPASRRLKYAMLLGALVSGTLLVWGLVDRMRETSDTVN